MAELSLEQELFLKQLKQAFAYLDVNKYKSLFLNDDNYQILKIITEEKLDCLLNNHCSEDGFHLYPKIEMQKDQTLKLVLERNLCDKQVAFINTKISEHYFLIDDYTNKTINNFAKCFNELNDYFINDEVSESDRNYLNLIVSKTFNDKTQSNDNLISLFINGWEKIACYEYLMHEYCLELAKNNNYVAYIDLICYFDAFKNRFRNDLKFIEYTNALNNANLIVLSNIDALSFDDMFWGNLLSLLKDIYVNNKKLVVLSSIDFHIILENAANKKGNIILIKKVFETILQITDNE